jgi:hypothetical protein
MCNMRKCGTSKPAESSHVIFSGGTVVCCAWSLIFYVDELGAFHVVKEENDFLFWLDSRKFLLLLTCPWLSWVLFMTEENWRPYGTSAL